MVGRPRLPAALCAFVACVLAACDAPDPFMPDRAEPGLYMILYPGGDPLARLQDGSGALHGLLVRTGTPLETTYLRPDALTMTRARDGLRLGWEIRDLTGEATAFNYAGGLLNQGNLRLPRSATVAGAGAESIEPGDHFDLVVSTPGGDIRGSVDVPLRPVVRAVEKDGRTVFSWSPVPGAGAYEATFRGADGTFEELPLGRDTMLTVFRPILEGDQISVYTYDRNLAAYLLDDTLVRAGIDRGFGFLGAVVSADLAY